MTFLFVAYAVTWAMIFGYVVSLARRRRQILRESESVTQALQQQESAAGPTD